MPDQYSYNTGNGAIPVVNPGDAALPKEELDELRTAAEKYRIAIKRLSAVREELDISGDLKAAAVDDYVRGYLDAVTAVRSALEST